MKFEKIGTCVIIYNGQYYGGVEVYLRSMPIGIGDRYYKLPDKTWITPYLIKLNGIMHISQNGYITNRNGYITNSYHHSIYNGLVFGSYDNLYYKYEIRRPTMIQRIKTLWKRIKSYLF